MNQHKLTTSIRNFYDRTTPGWLDVWGDHLHHGYYGRNGGDKKDSRQAQIDMVDEVLNWAAIGDGPIRDILDVGCGVGGSARLLASRFGAYVVGITLSPVQVDLASSISEGQSGVEFQVQDAMKTSFAEESFDLVWSLESAEHMPSKHDFLEECTRVLRPGGTLIVATWCHRPTPPALSAGEQAHLQKTSWSFGESLTWVPLGDYRATAQSIGLVDIRTDDWTSSVGQFWKAVLKSAISARGLKAMAGGGLATLRGLYGGVKMELGMRSGLVRYVVFRATKPARGTRP